MKIPFWATFLSICGVLILCTLGNWQLQRLAWKQQVMDKLEVAYAGEGDDLIDFGSLEVDGFVYGRVEGVFLPDEAILLGPRMRDGEIGADLIMPLITAQGTLFVNMGWSDKTMDALSFPYMEEKEIRVEGLARPVSWNSFTPDNQPERDLWFKPDLQEIAQAKGLKEAIAFMLFAEHVSEGFGDEFPNNERWEPNNNHQKYAFFWFAMAAVLVVIYALRFLRPEKV